MKPTYTPTHRGGITLKKLKRWPSLRRHFIRRDVRIWSGEWAAWWREGGHGYTTDIREAGQFTLDSAMEQSNHAGPEKQIEYVPV